MHDVPHPSPVAAPPMESAMPPNRPAPIRFDRHDLEAALRPVVAAIQAVSEAVARVAEAVEESNKIVARQKPRR